MASRRPSLSVGDPGDSRQPAGRSTTAIDAEAHAIRVAQRHDAKISTPQPCHDRQPSNNRSSRNCYRIDRHKARCASSTGRCEPRNQAQSQLGRSPARASLPLSIVPAPWNNQQRSNRANDRHEQERAKSTRPWQSTPLSRSRSSQLCQIGQPSRSISFPSERGDLCSAAPVRIETRSCPQVEQVKTW